jgi:hypothetical protein
LAASVVTAVIACRMVSRSSPSEASRSGSSWTRIALRSPLAVAISPTPSICASWLTSSVVAASATSGSVWASELTAKTKNGVSAGLTFR